LTILFARLRLQALLVNRLFYVSQNYKESFQMKQYSANIFKMNEFNEVVMKFPTFIDLQYLRFFLCCCCFKDKNSRFVSLKALIHNGSDEITAELDLSRFVRRLRSYSIALHFLISKKQQTIISRMSAYKPLREKDKNHNLEDKTISWQNIHNQNYQDRFQYNLFHKYSNYLINLKEHAPAQDSISVTKKLTQWRRSSTLKSVHITQE
jgi:hypothetical protein